MAIDFFSRYSRRHSGGKPGSSFQPVTALLWQISRCLLLLEGDIQFVVKIILVMDLTVNQIIVLDF
jgi:hypothetical protein